jgi:hypothetical protein
LPSACITKVFLKIRNRKLHTNLKDPSPKSIKKKKSVVKSGIGSGFGTLEPTFHQPNEGLWADNFVAAPRTLTKSGKMWVDEP